jgi:hypothetical protein
MRPTKNDDDQATELGDFKKGALLKLIMDIHFTLHA